MPKKATTQPQPCEARPGQINQHEFTAVYRKHRDKVRRLIWLMTTDNDLSADLTQDTFVTIYHNLHRHDPAKGDVQRWILRIAKNTVITYFRRPDYRSTKPISKQWSTDEEADHHLSALVHCWQPEVEGESEGIALRTLVAELNPILRESLELFYIGGLDCAEIAEKMNCPIGTVLARLRYARQHLQRRLNGKQFVTAAEGHVYVV